MHAVSHPARNIAVFLFCIPLGIVAGALIVPAIMAGVISVLRDMASTLPVPAGVLGMLSNAYLANLYFGFLPGAMVGVVAGIIASVELTRRFS